MDPPRPLKTIVDEVTFPRTITVPTLEGIVSTVVVVEFAVHTPSMHTKSAEGEEPLHVVLGVIGMAIGDSA